MSTSDRHITETRGALARTGWFADVLDETPSGDAATTTFGPQWVNNVLSWIELDRPELITDTYRSSSGIRWILPEGGSDSFALEGEGAWISGYIGKHGAMIPPDPSQPAVTITPVSRLRAQNGSAKLTWDGFNRWTIRYPDGSRLEYGNAQGRRVFLTKRADAFGNEVTYAYAGARVDRVITADGLALTFRYARLASGGWVRGLTAAQVEFVTEPVRVDSVTEPYGRRAAFEYDSAGRLTVSRDMLGYESKFSYDEDGFLNRLQTPYGVTTFRASAAEENWSTSGVIRWIEATDPTGYPERLEFTRNVRAPDIPAGNVEDPSSAPAGSVPVVTAGPASKWGAGWHPWNDRDAYYWSKKAYHHSAKDTRGVPTDRSKAVLTHFLLGSGYTVSGTVGSTLNPGESRVWYAYPGQTSGDRVGLFNKPVAVGRKTSAGDAISFFDYNAQGNLVAARDPVGRTVRHTYSADGIDLLQTFVMETSDRGRLIVDRTYDRHLPITITDVSGRVTTLGYNDRGQVQTITGADGLVTEIRRDDGGRPVFVKGPVPPGTNDDATTRKTILNYDDGRYGLPHRITDGEGYAVTYDYDAFGRVTRADHPDGSHEDYTYDCLNVTSARDRAGRETTYAYDGRGLPSRITDPLGRVTFMEWCLCGGLQKLTTPGGVVSWEYDHAARLVARVMSDGSRYAYAYDPYLGKLASITTPGGRVSAFSYHRDGSLAGTTAPYASYAYDAVYPLLASVDDDTGRTTFTYHGAGPGALRLASVDGPLPGDVDKWFYDYDPFGRLAAKDSGAGIHERYVYDALGRPALVANALGGRSLSYVGDTGRLVDADGPGPIHTGFSYDTLANDFRLTEINHRSDTLGALDRHRYGYAADRSLSVWDTLRHPSVTRTRRAAHDSVGRLLSMAVLNESGEGEDEAFSYDIGDNLLSMTKSGAARSFSPAEAYRVGELSGAGLLTLSGRVNEPASVTVNGVSATQTRDRWSARIPVAPENLLRDGTQRTQVEVRATDMAGNTTRKSWKIPVEVPRATFEYDRDGNLMKDLRRDTTWDEAGRLASVTVRGSGMTHAFTYDAAGRRVAERVNGAVTRRWVWEPGAAQPSAELNAAGTAVTKRFFAAGEQRLVSAPGAAEPEFASYYYTRDHLGSVREVLDATGHHVARYEYDAYGRRTTYAAPGQLPPPDDFGCEFGFTGHFTHTATGLTLTLHRAYDPETGRWLSMDPIWENGGVNLYGYVGGSPLMFMDPYGLWWGEDAWNDFLLSDTAGAIAGTADFAAGFGDSASFGLTRSIRDNLDFYNGTVNYCSNGYAAGEAAEVAFEVGVTLGSGALKSAAKNVSDKALRGTFRKMTSHIPRNGKQLHHINPLKGHPGGASTMFPTAALPASVHNSSSNLKLLSHAEHKLAHKALIYNEAGLKLMTHPSLTAGRAARDAISGEGCQ